uniref:BTB domain-containing protein n=1 Tax=Rhabditophanes sp. KR3021 TaxID=114890 RepID=A0AC35TSD2_9BILA
MRSALLLEQYHFEREELQKKLARVIVEKMTCLIDNLETADLLLVAADGRKLAVHKCILRARAPGFFQRHIEPTLKATSKERLLSGEILEVAIGDIDSYGLEFFVKSVYTEEEISRFPPQQADVNVMKESMSDNHENKDEDPENENLSLNIPSDSLEHSPVTNEDVEESSSTPMNFDDTTKEEEVVVEQLTTRIPVMTSFKQLGSQDLQSSMVTSGYSEHSNQDLMSMSYDERRAKSPALDESGPKEFDAESKISDSPSKGKGIFNMFIGLGGEASREFPSQVAYGVRGKTMLARRLSVTSLNSLTSLDLTPFGESSTMPQYDQNTACKLAQDLLEMYLNQEDTDVTVKTSSGDLKAHKCILSVTCNFFKRALKKGKTIELTIFSKTSVNFLLSFLYGGLTTIPEEVDVWELIGLATHLDVPELGNVVSLHLKAYRCHYFHRPCSSCVSAIFDALPQFAEIKCLNSLYEEAMEWQSKHFGRIWKGRVFLYLNERCQRECLEYLIQKIDSESVIDVLLSCEKLQISLPRSKLPHAAESVKLLVNELIEYCVEFVGTSFDLILESTSFINHGKGLALNLSLLEDLLPNLIHSLTSETAIRGYKVLSKLLVDIENQPKTEQRGPVKPLTINEFSPRFMNLCRRLYELIDKHLLHYASSVIKSEAWVELSPKEQERIKESGLFIEMQEPKGQPPKFSSLDRTYKRSSSVGISANERSDLLNRKASVERRKLLSEHVIIESMDEREREKSMQIIMSNAAKERAEAKQKMSELEKAAPPVIASPTVSPKIAPPARSGSRSRMDRLKHDSSFSMNREDTHVIMTVHQNKAAGLDAKTSDLPTASKKLISPKVKPQSVVKPMVKDVPFASSTKVPRISSSRTPISKEIPTATTSRKAFIPESKPPAQQTTIPTAKTTTSTIKRSRTETTQPNTSKKKIVDDKKSPSRVSSSKSNADKTSKDDKNIVKK